MTMKTKNLDSIIPVARDCGSFVILRGGIVQFKDPHEQKKLEKELRAFAAMAGMFKKNK